MWDKFMIRAVHASTGMPLWNTSQLGVSVVLGGSVPTIHHGAVLVTINDQARTCQSMKFSPYFIAAVSLNDGSLLGRVKSPARYPPYAATRPVAAEALWIFGETSDPPQMLSTI